MIQIWNSLNVKLHLYLTTLSAKQPTSHVSWQAHHWKTTHTPSLPLCRMYATLSCLQYRAKYPLCSLQTCKSLYLPWQNQLLCSYLAHRLPTTMPILCHQILPRRHFNSAYDVYRQHRIPHSDLTVFSDASWQNCPVSGCSTVRYIIFHNGALIKANFTMPMPIAMSTPGCMLCIYGHGPHLHATQWYDIPRN